MKNRDFESRNPTETPRIAMDTVEEMRHPNFPSTPKTRSALLDRKSLWPNQAEQDGEREPSQFDVAFDRIERNAMLAYEADDAFRLEFVSAGNCILIRDGERIELPAGSVFCIMPRSEYRIEAKGDNELDRFRLSVQGPQAAEVLISTFGDSLSPRRIAQYRWIHDLFRQIQDTSEKGGPRAKGIANLLFLALIERIAQLDEGDQDTRCLAELTYERCRACLNAHFKTLRGIGDLAAKCNVSAAYLSRLFKRYANSTPSQLLARCKMNHAAELLLNENRMVKEVATLVGYDDPYYFSRSFKQFFGVSPKRFALEASSR